MNVQRCPECGQRLKTNYCDICMRKVPFGGVKLSNRKDPWESRDGSSAHRMERGHECVSFGDERKVTWAGSSAHRMEKGHACVSFEKEANKPRTAPAKKQTPATAKKGATIFAVILGLLSLLPTFFGLVEDLFAVDEIPVPPPETSIYENVPAIESREVYNDGEISVTVDHAQLYYDDYAVFMTVYNESDEDILVSSDLLSVNGYMHESGYFADVEAGSAVQEPLQLYTWELEEDGIQDVAEIAFYLNFYREDDYTDLARSELITLETELADTYIPPESPNGMDLYADEDVLVRLVSCSDNSENIALRFYMENLSGEDLSVSTPMFCINGEETGDYFWVTLRGGTRSVFEAYVGNSGTVQLQDLEEITMELLIEYLDGYEIVRSRSAVITFAP